jgi:hypothetical protein
MRSVSAAKEETQAPDRLTETIVDKLNNPSTSSDFDFHEGVNQVLEDVGMSAADSGGQLTFYGQDPIIPSRIRFATMAGIGLAAKTIAAAAVWRDRTGQGQDVHVDVRKAFRRFGGFFEGIWETVNGRSPAMAGRDVYHYTNAWNRPLAHDEPPRLLRYPLWEDEVIYVVHEFGIRDGSPQSSRISMPVRDHAPSDV